MTANHIGGRLYRMYLGALAAALVGNLVVRMIVAGRWLPGAVAVLVAVAAMVPLAVTAIRFRYALERDLDELMQKVVLQGFAFGLIVWLPLAALYVNLASAGVDVPRMDPPDLVMVPAILVAAGIALAARRYR